MPRPAAYRGRILLAALSPFAGFYQALAPFPLYVGWRTGRGFDDGDLAVIFGTYIVGVAAALVTAPRLARRLGTRTVLVLGSLAGLAACLLLTRTGTLSTTAGARFGAGLCSGVAASVGVGTVLASRGGSRAGAFAVQVASGTVIVGSGTGALASSLLARASRVPDDSVFMVAAVLLVVSTLCTVCLPTHRAPLNPAPVRSQRLGRQGVPAVAAPVCLFAATYIPMGFFLSLGPSLFTSVRQGRTIDVGVVGVMGTLIFASAYAGQVVAVRAPRPLRVVLGLALPVVATVLIFAAVVLAAPWLVLLGGVAAGAGNGAGQYTGLSVIRERIPGASVPSVTALCFLVGYGLNGVVPNVVGQISTRHSLTFATAVLLAIVTGFAVLATFVLVRSRPRPPVVAATPPIPDTGTAGTPERNTRCAVS